MGPFRRQLAGGCGCRRRAPKSKVLVMSERTVLSSKPPALLFDLDGTLIDSVYQHVLAWQEALAAFGIELSVWKIHRRIGMSGGLFVTALLRETGGVLSAGQNPGVHPAPPPAHRDPPGP